MNRKSVLGSAIAGLVAASALSGTAVAQEKKAEREKCYGVAEKGKNDCGTAKHSCAGQAAADKLPEEWKFVPKGSCEKMGGSLKHAADKKSDAKGPAKAPEAPKK
jgi:uncharacterized membrane protein